MGPLFSDPRRKPARPAVRWFAGNSSIDLQSTTLSQYRTLWSKVKYDHERRINADGQAFARETNGYDPRESEEPQIEEPQIGEPVVQSNPALIPTPAAAAPPPSPPPPPPPPEPSWVMVTFNVRATTRPGETIHLTGNLSELRNWNPDVPISLDCSQSYPTWTSELCMKRSM
ncbi:hypothetical protein FRC04_004039 [Tulasnella sp. 424]|nr:hypothetical protein FRC04_004039 [Tulasnella sp. 424]KAG8962017.1 hypothetical protein FRC05_005635 [Tulasnella sp. 425]